MSTRLVAAVLLCLGASAQEAASSTSPTRDAAIAVLQRAQKAAGGAAKLASIKTLDRTLEMVQAGTGAQASQTVFILFPNAIRLTNTIGKGEMIAYCDDSTSWQQSPFGVENPIPEWQRKAAQQDILRQWENILLSDRNPKLELRSFGSETVEGRKLDHILVVDPTGGPIHLWVDEAGKLAQLQYPRITPRGFGTQVLDRFVEYMTHDGITVPSRIKTSADGQDYMEYRVARIQYNRAITKEELSRMKPGLPAAPAPAR